MAENVYLKTVNFGGFDKKETLQYIDKLLSDIYKLEAEVKEKDDMIASLESGDVQNFSGKEELEAKLDEGKSKISELQASNDTLKLQVANYESDVTERDEKIVKLQEEIDTLKEKLENAESNAGGGAASDFDLGSVFVEAKKTADKVVVEAKKAAKKLEDDAKELQNQILEDANTQAASIVENANAQAAATIANANAQAETTVSAANAEAQTTISTANAQAEATISSANAQASATIANANAQAESTVSDANAKAEATLSNARNESATIREKSAGLRSAVKAEYTALEANINKLSEVFRELFGDNMVKIDSTKELVEEGLGLVKDDVNFNNDLKGSGVSGKENKNNKKLNKKAEEKHEKHQKQEKKEEPAAVKSEEPKPDTIHNKQAVSEEELNAVYTPEDIDAAQEYFAKLLAEAEAEAQAALGNVSQIQPEEETPAVEEAEKVEEPVKPATYSKSFDLDMLSALTKEIEAGKDNDRKLSDEEFLKQWKKK